MGFGARSFGGAFEEASQNGATLGQATAYAVGSTAVELGTEWLTGGIPGVKGTAGGGLDELAEKYIFKEGLEEASKSLGKQILKTGYKLAGEATEEELSAILEPFLKQFTYEYDKNKSLGENFSEAKSNLSLQQVLTEGILGAMSAGILNAPVDIQNLNITNQRLNAINTWSNNNDASAKKLVNYLIK